MFTIFLESIAELFLVLQMLITKSLTPRDYSAFLALKKFKVSERVSCLNVL